MVHSATVSLILVMTAAAQMGCNQQLKPTEAAAPESPPIRILATATMMPTEVSEPIPTATPRPTAAPTETLKPTAIQTVSVTVTSPRMMISDHLYLDENSSPEKLLNLPRTEDNSTGFSNRSGSGFIMQYGEEEWVTAIIYTHLYPYHESDDPIEPNDYGLTQYYL